MKVGPTTATSSLTLLRPPHPRRHRAADATVPESCPVETACTLPSKTRTLMSSWPFASWMEITSFHAKRTRSWGPSPDTSPTRILLTACMAASECGTLECAVKAKRRRRLSAFGGAARVGRPRRNHLCCVGAGQGIVSARPGKAAVRPPHSKEDTRGRPRARNDRARSNAEKTLASHDAWTDVWASRGRCAPDDEDPQGFAEPERTGVCRGT